VKKPDRSQRPKRPEPHRLRRQQAPSVRAGGYADPGRRRQARPSAVIECGWGRLIMAHTYPGSRDVAGELAAERRGERDIAMYVASPHELLARDPVSLFLDPSHTFRLWLAPYNRVRNRAAGFQIRRVHEPDDARAINVLYARAGMVEADAEFIWRKHGSRTLTYIVAEDRDSGEIIGTITGVDHVHGFSDPENGASFWCLAVDPQARHPGVGEALVRYLIDLYRARGRDYLDLSVMHDNEQAIALYRKLGFQRIQTFAVKRRNPINTPLFTGPTDDESLNPYARIIVNEARRRGIHVEVLDAANGYFRLEHGSRRITTRESLSELTSAVAMSRCQDKQVTARVLAAAGLRVPRQREAGSADENRDFLNSHAPLVVKPLDSEQGRGISVNVTEADELERAIRAARRISHRVLLEQFHRGHDLRVIVIDRSVVAAAIRHPPMVTGTGRDSIRRLIEKQSRRRAAATGGESRIPIDDETRRAIARAGWSLDDVLPEREDLVVRDTANLHAGGTIEDVTPRLHRELAEVSIRAAEALEIPVVGLDLLVDSVDGPGYVIIEANERPGLANHEPQPTAERFVDLLFPLTRNHPNGH